MAGSQRLCDNLVNSELHHDLFVIEWLDTVNAGLECGACPGQAKCGFLWIELLPLRLVQQGDPVPGGVGDDLK